MLQAKQQLLLARKKRVRPHQDDKVLTDWNGLMASSFALGGKILHEPRYIDAAKKSADFILTVLKTKDGRLLHRFRDNAAEIPGFLDDYAFFANGLLDIYEAAFESDYLKEAVGLTEKMLQLFEDKTSGGFFFTADDAETILSSRSKEYYDGALPSGNSLATLVLLRLNRITLRKDFENAAQNSLQSVFGRMTVSPTAYTQMLTALDYALSPTKEIVVVSQDAKDTTVAQISSLIYSNFLPHKILLLRSPHENDPIASFASWTKNYDLIAGKPAVYVCENHTCNLPVTELKKLKNLLEAK